MHIAQKLKSQIDRYKKSLSPKKKRRIERYVAEIKATNVHFFRFNFNIFLFLEIKNKKR